MPDRPDETSAVLFDQGRTLQAVSRSRTLLVGAVVLGALLGLLYHLTRPESHAASAQVQLGSSVAASVLGVASSPQDALVAQSTAVSLLTAPSLQDEVERRLGPVEELTAALVEDSTLVVVTTTATTERRAVQATQAYVDAYLEYLRGRAVDDLEAARRDLEAQSTQVTAGLQDLDGQVAQAPVATQAEVLRQQAVRRAALTAEASRLSNDLDRVATSLASPPVPAQQATPVLPSTTPTGSSPFRQAVLGALTLGLLALGVVLVRQARDHRLHEAGDVRARARSRFLGVVPADDEDGDGAWSVVWAQIARHGTPTTVAVLSVLPSAPQGAAEQVRRLLAARGTEVAVQDVSEPGALPGVGRSAVRVGPSVTSSAGSASAAAGSDLVVLVVALGEARADDLADSLQVLDRLDVPHVAVVAQSPSARSSSARGTRRGRSSDGGGAAGRPATVGARRVPVVDQA